MFTSLSVLTNESFPLILYYYLYIYSTDTRIYGSGHTQAGPHCATKLLLFTNKA